MRRSHHSANPAAHYPQASGPNSSQEQMSACFHHPKAMRWPHLQKQSQVSQSLGFE